MSKYSKDTAGHDIIDVVVEKNRSINPEMYENARKNPAFFGATEIGEDEVKLQSITKKGNMAELKLISDIVQSVATLRLNPGDAEVQKLVDGKLISSKTHPEIIKIIKACVVASYSPSEDFREAVTGFVKALTETASNITVPLGVYTKNNIQAEIVSELEQFLVSVCEKNGIQYGPPITGSKVSALLKKSEG